MEEQEISSPAFKLTAPVERARSEMNGAITVPTQRYAGAKMITRMHIRRMFPPVTRNAATAMALFTIPANGRISFPGRIMEQINVTGMHKNTASQISFAPPMNGQSSPTTRVLSSNFLFINALIAVEIGSSAIMKYLEITGNNVREQDA